MKCNLVDKRNEAETALVFFGGLEIGQAVICGGVVRMRLSRSSYLYKDATDDVSGKDKSSWPHTGVPGEVVNIKLTMEVIAL